MAHLHTLKQRCALHWYIYITGTLVVIAYIGYGLSENMSSSFFEQYITAMHFITAEVSSLQMYSCTVFFEKAAERKKTDRQTDRQHHEQLVISD